MQIIDLFSGIGGFSIAGDWLGWRVVQFCEINNFGQKVLSYYFPGVPIHPDIKTLTKDLIINNGFYDKDETTIITGGVPCQPWSVAGKRKGTEDDRDLWDESINLVREIQPEWVVFENVPGLITWSKGMVFNKVQTDLEAAGYEVIPFILPACGVNAPHKRERIWFIAYLQNADKQWDGVCKKQYKGEIGRSGSRINKSGVTPDNSDSGIEAMRQRKNQVHGFAITPNPTGQGREERQSDNGRTDSEEDKAGMDNRSERLSDIGNVTDTINQGLQRDKLTGTLRQSGTKTYDTTSKRFEIQSWDKWPTQSPLCSRNDGFSSRLDGITFPKWRNESIKAMGNAIVPQVAFQIFKAIDQFNKL